MQCKHGATEELQKTDHLHCDFIVTLTSTWILMHTEQWDWNKLKFLYLRLLKWVRWGKIFDQLNHPESLHKSSRWQMQWHNCQCELRWRSELLALPLRAHSSTEHYFELSSNTLFLHFEKHWGKYLSITTFFLGGNSYLRLNIFTYYLGLSLCVCSNILTELGFGFQSSPGKIADKSPQ